MEEEGPAVLPEVTLEIDIAGEAIYDSVEGELVACVFMSVWLAGWHYSVNDLLRETSCHYHTQKSEWLECFAVFEDQSFKQVTVYTPRAFTSAVRNNDDDHA